ncbi:MAG: HIT family protein [Thermoplasmataceae archaeon]|jgi:bis(5'-nucleosidyl)-tetraphosphatase/histidine triad (HIT) family protein|nr:HIT family protein [Candidatus Thermoplasmatota archaeon]
MYDTECIFCTDVVAKRNAAIVYEDTDTMAFMDYAPVEEGHLLVIPKKHYESILDIESEDYVRVHDLVRKISPILLRALHADGLNVGQNNGTCANQVVMHYHVHMIPRFCSTSIPTVSDRGRFSDKPLKWERKISAKDDLAAIASIIRKEIEKPL